MPHDDLARAMFEAMQRRPAMYFGPPERRYTYLLGFIEGFQGAKVAGESFPHDLFAPPGFDDFVLQRLRPEWFGTAHSWREAIGEACQSDAHAYVR